jgi:hypothetical protein
MADRSCLKFNLGVKTMKTRKKETARKTVKPKVLRGGREVIDEEFTTNKRE